VLKMVKIMGFRMKRLEPRMARMFTNKKWLGGLPFVFICKIRGLKVQRTTRFCRRSACLKLSRIASLNPVIAR
jgi:hypothetical protein